MPRESLGYFVNHLPKFTEKNGSSVTAKKCRYNVFKNNGVVILDINDLVDTLL